MAHVHRFALFALAALAFPFAVAACSGADGDADLDAGGSTTGGECKVGASNAGTYDCGPSLACDKAAQFCVDDTPEAATADGGTQISNRCQAVPEACCGKVSCACLGKIECPDGRTSECVTNADGTVVVKCFK